MRATHNAKPLILDNKFVGVNLGADYCAEHEWGIDPLKTRLGIDSSKLGIEGRIVNIPLELGIQTFKRKKITGAQFFSKQYFGYDSAANTYKDAPDKPSVIPYLSKQPLEDYYPYLSSRWDENGFQIDAFNIQSEYDAIQQMVDLINASRQHDLAVWLNGVSNPFDRGGLVVAIVSRLPEEIKQNMLDADKDIQRLMHADMETGIKDRLAAANKGYYALVPHWLESRFNTTSKYPVVYWLNPRDQNLNNFGYYTVEDLDLWIENKGPIPKNIIKE